MVMQNDASSEANAEFEIGIDSFIRFIARGHQPSRQPPKPVPPS